MKFCRCVSLSPNINSMAVRRLNQWLTTSSSLMPMPPMSINCGGPAFTLSPEFLMSEARPRLIELVRHIEESLGGACPGYFKTLNRFEKLSVHGRNPGRTSSGSPSFITSGSALARSGLMISTQSVEKQKSLSSLRSSA